MRFAIILLLLQLQLALVSCVTPPPGESGAPNKNTPVDTTTSITPQGQSLQAFLASQKVESRWLPMNFTDWKTGQTLFISQDQGRKRKLPHTSHCSAFVASVAERLGVPFLDPENAPRGPLFLANQQNEWLHSDKARSSGWKSIDAVGAQAKANRGALVVASIANPNPRKAGHIAIVRPDTKTTDQIEKIGPTVVQVGGRSPRAPRGNAEKMDVANAFYIHTKGSLEGIEFFYNEKPQLSASRAQEAPSRQ